MTKRPQTKTTKQQTSHTQSGRSDKTTGQLPFIEHLYELRRRLFIVAVSVVVWSALAYAVEKSIVGWLLAPAQGEKFVYTTVGGGIDFLFRVCLYAGLLFSIPIILYQILRYIQPLIKRKSLRFIIMCSLVSAALAVAGVAFGYYFGLPSATKFLFNQMPGSDISAMITIQSYLSFVVLYLFGSSLLFQVPLVLFIINRITRIKPRTLLKQERWVIMISFVIGAMVNPSPRVYDMMVLALPMILSYQVGILTVWWVNRTPRKRRKLHDLRARDAERQAERLARLTQAQGLPVKPVYAASSQPAVKPIAKKAPAAAQPVTTARPVRPKPTAAVTPAARSQKYLNSFEFRPVRRRTGPYASNTTH
jgi:sec-independent protein translocase protein TatC